MKKLLLLIIVSICLIGCKSKVIYDNHTDEFMYKPARRIDYMYDLLGPANIPANPMRSD